MKKKHLLSNAEIAAFCQQIAMVVNAGLPTYYGISILLDDAPDEETRALLEQIYLPMEKGSTLFFALKETNVFPDYMIHMIELGETTGRLEEVLLSLSKYYEREASLKKAIKNAVSYPLIMTTMMLVVIVVLIAKVLPVFAQIYQELGSELTGFAYTMMSISTVLNRYLIVFVLIFVLLLAFAVISYYTDLGKKLFMGKGISLSIAASRFANCMYLALASGLDTDQGLSLAYDLVNDTLMQKRILKCKEILKDKGSFSDAILKADIFSKLYASLITIGYKTGSMDEVMLQIGESYEEETQNRIDHVISLLEPSLVIILSFFIGLILIAFLLPLLGIMSSIG